MSDHPNAGVLIDGPVVHHFDEPGWRCFRPGYRETRMKPWDIVAGQAPLDPFLLATEGGGADSTPGYVATEVRDADQFYTESTPVWWIPGRYYDLRDTWTVFYLKEIAPITVAPGYQPHLFIAAHMPAGRPGSGPLSCWYLREPLRVGRGEWERNEVLVANDEALWINYASQDPANHRLDGALARCGYIGWMYHNPAGRTLPSNDRLKLSSIGVRATGTMGFDEFYYNLKPSDLEDLRAGRPLRNALVL